MRRLSEIQDTRVSLFLGANKRAADVSDKLDAHLRPLSEDRAVGKLECSAEFIRWSLNIRRECGVSKRDMATYICRNTCDVSETRWAVDVSSR